MGILDKPDPSKVENLDDLLDFIQHYHGTSTSFKGKQAFYKGYAKFIDKHPEWAGKLDYQDLARVCEWGVKKRKGRARGASFLLYLVDDAVRAGAVPRLSPDTTSEDDDLYSILAIEDDPEWRKYLLGTSGSKRTQAIMDWKSEHG